MQPRHEITAVYQVKAKSMKQAAIAIARGQSIGNPNIKASYETKKLAKHHEATWEILEPGLIKINYPLKNFRKQGFNYMMSVLMGGQCDIDMIQECRLVDLDLGLWEQEWAGPRWGVDGVRKELGVYGRPLIGAIIKPKVGLKPIQIADIAKQMADGGVDFIKEDEIQNNQPFCPIHKRVPVVAKALESYKTIYTVCVTGDGTETWKQARKAVRAGATAVHANIWGSIGQYRDLYEHVKAPLFFQKSGDKVWTTGKYSIDYAIICKLISLAGCDFAHVGMYGGYMADTVGDLEKRIKALGKTIPSFSCGMNPELATQIKGLFGNDVMLTSGGWVCGYPGGITQAVKMLREAIA